MSQIGGPIQAGLAGSAGSQESTGRARARRDRQRSEVSRRFQDALDLTVAGVEAAEAIHGLDENDDHHDGQRKKHSSKDESQDPNAHRDQPEADDTGPVKHIDVTG